MTKLIDCQTPAVILAPVFGVAFGGPVLASVATARPITFVARVHVYKSRPS